MTYAPVTIRDLAKYWVDQGGANLGIVGDAAHQRRASYHNGQDVIEAFGRTSLTDYSISTPRDREPHLTNAASALDLGRLGGSLPRLQAFSRWLATRCSLRVFGTEDIRELIYSPDGKTVRRWDHFSGRFYTGGTGTGHGDDSHLWHTHISFYRDSEARSKLPLFLPYFVSLPDTSIGDIMQTFLAPEQPTRVLLKERAPGESVWMYETSSFLANGKEVSLKPNRMLNLVGETGVFVIVAYEPSGGDTNDTSKAMYVRPTDIARRELIPLTADCAAAVAAAVAPLHDEIGRLQLSLASSEAQAVRAAAVERDRIAEAEAARIRAL